MSRIDVKQLLIKNNNEEKQNKIFDFDALHAPPICAYFNADDINNLYKIATSIKYMANVSKKYDLIDEIMVKHGFRRAHCGTNRVVYDCIYDNSFVAKVAIDKVGIKDSPAEFAHQSILKPFCTKVFEVDPTGVMAFMEKVNPITSMEEFLSVAEDIYDMMLCKVIGKYVVDDLGCNKFMNYGLRFDNRTGEYFGPVLLDFPYVYELSGKKLKCNNILYGNHICNGDIDYDSKLSSIICTKCGKHYNAIDLKKDNEDILLQCIDKYKKSKGDRTMRVRLTYGDKVIVDTGVSSKRSLTKEELAKLTSINQPKAGDVFESDAKDIYYERRKPKKDAINDIINRLNKQIVEENEKKESFNKIGDSTAQVYVSDLNDTICENFTKATKPSNNGYVDNDDLIYDKSTGKIIIKPKLEEQDNQDLHKEKTIVIPEEDELILTTDQEEEPQENTNIKEKVQQEEESSELKVDDENTTTNDDKQQYTMYDIDEFARLDEMEYEKQKNNRKQRLANKYNKKRNRYDDMDKY